MNVDKLPQGGFFGQVLTSRTVSGFLLNETLYYAGASIPRHSHENGYFCLVRRGRYTEAYGARNRSCGPSTFAFHPADELHSEHFGQSDARSFNIEVPRDWQHRIESEKFRLDEPIDFQGGPITGLAARLYSEFKSFDGASALAIEGLILEVIAEAWRRLQCSRTRSMPDWLMTVHEMLHDRFTERLSLGEIAVTAGVHPVHLATAFRRHYGCTVGEYVRQLRIEYACNELEHSNRTLAEIALAAGFTDQSHLSRTLKVARGLTPKQHRGTAARLNPTQTS